MSFVLLPPPRSNWTEWSTLLWIYYICSQQSYIFLPLNRQNENTAWGEHCNSRVEHFRIPTYFRSNWESITPLSKALKEARYLVPLTNGALLLFQLCWNRTDLLLSLLITCYLDWPRKFCERLWVIAPVFLGKSTISWSEHLWVVTTLAIIGK